MLEFLLFGLMYLVSLFDQKKTAEPEETHFIYMDDSGRLKNMWERSVPDDTDQNDSEFDS